IKIASSSTIISTLDPVRVYEDFATIDLISDGRAEIIAGRASRVGNFELLGYDLHDYEALYEEKFDLLRLINEHEVVNWEGQFRKPLRNAQILPGLKTVQCRSGGQSAAPLQVLKKPDGLVFPCSSQHLEARFLHINTRLMYTGRLPSRMGMIRTGCRWRLPDFSTLPKQRSRHRGRSIRISMMG